MADSADPQRAVAVCVYHVLQAACDLAGALRVAAEEEGSRPAADCEVAEARLREAVLPAVCTAERDKPRSTCICRVPRLQLEAEAEKKGVPVSFKECVNCGCHGCASTD